MYILGARKRCKTTNEQLNIAMLHMLRLLALACSPLSHLVVRFAGYVSKTESYYNNYLKRNSLLNLHESLTNSS